jgi:diadenosine tetraphosphatase ApaH/serine/threonine PP2A family protein phosphatase
MMTFAGDSLDALDHLASIHPACQICNHHVERPALLLRPTQVQTRLPAIRGFDGGAVTPDLLDHLPEQRFIINAENMANGPRWQGTVSGLSSADATAT